MGISVDTREVSQGLAKKLGLEFPLLSDPDRNVIQAYGVADDSRTISRPATFVVNSDGKVVFAHVGENPRDRPDVNRVLGALPDQPAKKDDGSNSMSP